MGIKFDTDDLFEAIIGAAFISLGIMGALRVKDRSFSMVGVLMTVLKGGRDDMFGWKLPLLAGFITPGCIAHYTNNSGIKIAGINFFFFDTYSVNSAVAWYGWLVAGLCIGLGSRLTRSDEIGHAM